MIYILTAKEINVMALCKTARITEVVQNSLESKIPNHLLVNFYLKTGQPLLSQRLLPRLPLITA